MMEARQEGRRLMEIGDFVVSCSSRESCIFFLIIAYERGHQRTPLTVYTFQPPLESSSHPVSPTSTPVTTPIVDTQANMQGKLLRIQLSHSHMWE